MKYMTAKEEDILSNANFIRQGTVIDKLLQSMIVTPGVDYNLLLNGDKNAILIAARILGYGQDYEFMHKFAGMDEPVKVSVDLSKLEPKPLKEDLIKSGINSFEFTLPTSKTVITFKALTHADEVNIEREVNKDTEAVLNC